MGAGIMAEKIPMRVRKRRKDELKLKDSIRMDNPIPPIAMSHS